jgi:hypothetical protein
MTATLSPPDQTMYRQQTDRETKEACSMVYVEPMVQPRCQNGTVEQVVVWLVQVLKTMISKRRITISATIVIMLTVNRREQSGSDFLHRFCLDNKG